MDIPKEDKKILQELGKEVAEISAMPIHKENAERWRQLNGLERVKPLIWINEIPWHELNIDDELTLRTSSDFCRNVETQLRQMIYQWRHMPGDMIVEPMNYLVRGHDE